MSGDCLDYQRRGAVAIVSIDDAPHNRMSFAFMDALESLVATIASDAAIRAVVMTAAGDANFSVGMNLKELVGVLNDPARLDVILDQRLRVLATIENMDKPWVATLFGNCLGADSSSRWPATSVSLRPTAHGSVCRNCTLAPSRPGAGALGWLGASAATGRSISSCAPRRSPAPRH